MEADRLALCTFVASEVLFFGGLFTVYSAYRWLHPKAFAAGSQHLALLLGSVNTGLLLTSSLTMALAVDALRLGRRRRSLAFLATTPLLGAVFLGIKGFEYLEKFHEGLMPALNLGAGVRPGVELFLNLYLVMTGLHALHLLLGVAAVALLAWGAWRSSDATKWHGPAGLVGVYWHFVDVIWIFLFPLLYLVGRG